MAMGEIGTGIVINKLLQNVPEVDGKKCYIYMQSSWTDPVELLLLVTKSDKCYRATLPKTEIEEAAEELEIPGEQFYNECVNALTANIAWPDFEYELDETKLTFRLVKKEPFATEYLSMTLTEAHHHRYDILDKAIEMLDAEQKKGATVQHADDNTTQSAQFQELLECYQTTVEEKNVLEQKMLRKFMALLETKKRKLRELRQLASVESDEDGDDGAEQEEDATNRPKRAKRSATTTTNADIAAQPSSECAASDNSNDSDSIFQLDTQPGTPPEASDEMSG